MSLFPNFSRTPELLRTKCIPKIYKCNKSNLQCTCLCECIGCKNDGTDEQFEKEQQYSSVDDNLSSLLFKKKQHFFDDISIIFPLHDLL